MSQTVSVWLVVLLAFFGANFPFASTRLLGVFKPSQPKTLGTRLIELVFLYGLVGGLGLLLENQVGQIAPQGWEFYAITATLFLTFAFPGFVYRYLFKHRD
ncbi:MAG: DUF2818 family protein [Rhodoferax sp.]|nr:DUF2818 family protein [Rhodoferax sp.]